MQEKGGQQEINSIGLLRISGLMIVIHTSLMRATHKYTKSLITLPPNAHLDRLQHGLQNLSKLWNRVFQTRTSCAPVHTCRR